VKSKAAVTLLSLRFIRVGDMSSICLIGFIGVFVSSFSSLHLRGSRFGSRTNVFLLGKAEIAAKTRQVFIRRGKTERFWSTTTCFRLSTASSREDASNYQTRVLGTHLDSRSQFAPFRVSNAIGYAKFYSRSHDAVIRVTMTLAT